MRNIARRAFLLCFCAPPPPAQLSIEITGAGGQRIPIAIAPFAGEGALGRQPASAAIVRADLERSGLFRMLEVPALNPPLTEASAVNFPDWRARLADALVLGSVAARPDGRFEVRFKLFDARQEAPICPASPTRCRASRCAPPRTGSPTSSTRS